MDRDRDQVADTGTAGPVAGRGGEDLRRLDPYVPRVLLRHLAETPDARLRTLDGTLLLADVSGFTQLSERLARRGREGAEELVESIGDCFEALLAVAYADGGSLLKLAGDALLLLFEGDQHLARACSAAVAMRRELHGVGRLETSAGRAQLRMSQGIHSGELQLFVVGGSHRELLVVGPAATTVTRMEKEAKAGAIVVSAAAAELLAPASVGARAGAGHVLSSPPPRDGGERWPGDAEPSLEAVGHCLSTEVRAHVMSGHQPPEHRNVTVAFVRFQGVDALIARDGPDVAAAALDELVRDVQRAADAQQVCFLESDTAIDGGSLMLTAGAPRIVGGDEERMLLALREIVTGERRLAVRVGVNRGNAFCADLGPAFRRSYSVMGDAVNLAARLTAQAPPGWLYATADVLDRSAIRFGVTELKPFAVKGKARPVRAWSVGPAVGSRAREIVAQQYPIVGRKRELALLQTALESTRAGAGRIVEISGEAGIGKTRLVEELRARAPDLRRLHATCEAYTATTPYAAWQELLRPLVGCELADPGDVVVQRLREQVEQQVPELLPWLALIAIPFGAEADAAPEVQQLAPTFRLARLHAVVRRLLEALLATPTLLEIQDVHAMDAASSELLHALAERVGERPWLVLLTRGDRPGGHATAAGAAVVQLELEGLDPDEVAALAAHVTDVTPLRPHLVALAGERSDGNPQYLRDLLAAMDADADAALPDSLEAAAMALIDRLSAPDRMLLRRAAVLGLTFHPIELADVLDRSELPDEGVWERLAGLVVRDSGGIVRFRRAVVRDAAYAGLPFRTRRRLHATVAARLEREAASSNEEWAEVRTLHFALAGDHRGTWAYAREAGDRARDRLAHADAASSYRLAIRAGRALDVADGELASVWEALAEALARTGALVEADDALRSARRLAGADRVRQAELMLHHARLAERAGRVASAVRWARRGMRELDGLDVRAAGAARARLLSVLATVRQREGRANDAIALCDEAMAAAERAGEDAALAHACFILDWALFDSGRADEATHSARALEIYTALGDLDRQAAVLNNLGGFAYHQGRWADAVELYRRAADASLRAGDASNAAFGDCNVGEVLCDQGHLDEAEQRLRRALRIWRGSENDWGSAFATAVLGRVAMRAGRHEEAIELLEGSLREFRRLRAASDAAQVAAYLAEALAFARDADAALERSSQLLAGAQRTAPLLYRVRAFALAQGGDADLARAALEESAKAAREQRNDYELAVTLDALDALDAAGALRRRRRDALLARLNVVRLAPAPVAPARAERAILTTGD